MTWSLDQWQKRADNNSSLLFKKWRDLIASWCGSLAICRTHCRWVPTCTRCWSGTTLDSSTMKIKQQKGMMSHSRLVPWHLDNDLIMPIFLKNGSTNAILCFKKNHGDEVDSMENVVWMRSLFFWRTSPKLADILIILFFYSDTVQVVGPRVLIACPTLQLGLSPHTKQSRCTNWLQ